MFFERKISTSMLERKKRHVTLEIKSVDEQGCFKGYASVFGVLDNQNDILVPGAFSASLYGRVHDIKLLWQHQQSEPIGVFDVIREDKRGLYVEGRLLLQVQKAQEAYALLKERAISGLSIGYSPVRYHIDPATQVRELREVALWEISLVTFPANSDAQVSLVKHDNLDDDVTWATMQDAGIVVDLSDALDNAIHALRY